MSNEWDKALRMALTGTDESGARLHAGMRKQSHRLGAIADLVDAAEAAEPGPIRDLVLKELEPEIAALQERSALVRRLLGEAAQRKAMIDAAERLPATRYPRRRS